MPVVFRYAGRFTDGDLYPLAESADHNRLAEILSTGTNHLFPIIRRLEHPMI